MSPKQPINSVSSNSLLREYHGGEMFPRQLQTVDSSLPPGAAKRYLANFAALVGSRDRVSTPQDSNPSSR